MSFMFRRSFSGVLATGSEPAMYKSMGNEPAKGTLCMLSTEPDLVVSPKGFRQGGVFLSLTWEMWKTERKSSYMQSGSHTSEWMRDNRICKQVMQRKVSKQDVLWLKLKKEAGLDRYLLFLFLLPGFPKRSTNMFGSICGQCSLFHSRLFTGS